MSTYRKVVLLECGALLIKNEDRRSLGLVPGLDDDLVLVVRVLVCRLLAVCRTCDHVLETYCTGCLDDGNRIVRIPFADKITFLNRIAIFLVQNRSVRNVV